VKLTVCAARHAASGGTLAVPILAQTAAAGHGGVPPGNAGNEPSAMLRTKIACSFITPPAPQPTRYVYQFSARRARCQARRNASPLSEPTTTGALGGDTVATRPPRNSSSAAECDGTENALVAGDGVWRTCCPVLRLLRLQPRAAVMRYTFGREAPTALPNWPVYLLDTQRI
jgi:hypothetical protein